MPRLVCINVVKVTLEWLKINHVDYEDLQISLANLNSYPLAGVPVYIEYSKIDPDSGNKMYIRKLWRILSGHMNTQNAL